jgi:hypothetical protein
MAQETPEPSAESFAYCAALAQASAAHQQTIAKDEQSAQAMMMVANGYRAAAVIKASQSTNAPEAAMDKIIDERKTHYAAQLTAATDVPAQKFTSDVEACKKVEPHAYKLIDDYNKQHAQPAN